VRFTWRAIPGSHTFVMSVDPRNRIAESDEADNKGTRHKRIA
jgi:subtilase family serine protease